MSTRSSIAEMLHVRAQQESVYIPFLPLFVLLKLYKTASLLYTAIYIYILKSKYHAD